MPISHGPQGWTPSIFLWGGGCGEGEGMGSGSPAGRAEGEGEAQQAGSQGALVAMGSSELVPRPWPQKRLPLPSPE